MHVATAAAAARFEPCTSLQDLLADLSSVRIAGERRLPPSGRTVPELGSGAAAPLVLKARTSLSSFFSVHGRSRMMPGGQTA